jgi:hypothetical protein
VDGFDDLGVVDSLQVGRVIDGVLGARVPLTDASSSAAGRQRLLDVPRTGRPFARCRAIGVSSAHVLISGGS